MAGSGRSSRAYDKQDTQRRGGVLCTAQQLQRSEDGWKWKDVEDIDEETAEWWARKSEQVRSATEKNN